MIVFRHAEHGLLAPVRVDHRVRKVLAAVVRVGLKLIDRYRLRITCDPGQLVVFCERRNGWDHHVGTFGLRPRNISQQLLTIGNNGFSCAIHAEQLMRWWPRHKPKSYPRAIRLWLPSGLVVDVEYDIHVLAALQ